MKQLSILGSTGSIGTQTLNIVRASGGRFRIAALAAGQNAAAMEAQAREFSPALVCMASEKAALDVRGRLADTSIRVVSGEEGLLDVASFPSADMVVGAIVGIAGLRPVLRAIDEGKDIALANKETLVTAGDIVMARAREKGLKILPVDSEHSAIFQCLMGQPRPKKLYLTASGGPFFGKSRDELAQVTLKQALSHPTWKMGKKITVDSASLANKGLEVIEAMHLFSMPESAIEVCVHRQSVIHSMVEFCDGAILAQLGSADMQTPISVALNYPDRSEVSGRPLDVFSMANLTFERPDTDTFRMLALAYRAAQSGGTMPAVYNGANEAAVCAFIEGKIGFLDIDLLVEGAMECHKKVAAPTLSEILDADSEAGEFVRRHI